MIAHDFLEEQEGDIKISDGDFVVGESDKDHIRDIINSSPGHWKQFPLQGIDPPRYLNSKNTLQTLKNVINEKLTMDGYIKIVQDITLSNGSISGEVYAQRK